MLQTASASTLGSYMSSVKFNTVVFLLLICEALQFCCITCFQNYKYTHVQPWSLKYDFNEEMHTHKLPQQVWILDQNVMLLKRVELTLANYQ